MTNCPKMPKLPSSTQWVFKNHRIIIEKSHLGVSLSRLYGLDFLDFFLDSTYFTVCSVVVTGFLPQLSFSFKEIALGNSPILFLDMGPTKKIDTEGKVICSGKEGVYIIRWDFNEGFLFHVAHRKYLPLDGVRIRYRPFERQMPLDIRIYFGF
jgi:hypothetical protein